MINIEQRIELAIMNAVSTARLLIPYRTRNLKLNSFKWERVNEKEWRVYIDLDIAPYAPYVNEKWISPKWKGKQNPNEGFFQKVYQYIANSIASAVSGQIVIMPTQPIET